MHGLRRRSQGKESLRLQRDTKSVGDYQQRLGDHGRLQSFMTYGTLQTFFPLFLRHSTLQLLDYIVLLYW